MAHYPKRILVVEDNKLDMRLLKDILEGSGYETLQAADDAKSIASNPTSVERCPLRSAEFPVALLGTGRFEGRRCA
jgi:CheY-like chemotaxis protein